MSEDTDRSEEADPLGTLDGDGQNAAPGADIDVDVRADADADADAEGELSIGSATGDGDGEMFDDRTGTAPDADPAGSGESIVPKRSYCERCEFFAEPPAVGCSHDGTRIVEMVDREHFRVVDCPVVAEREALAAESGGTRDDDHAP
jgi:hypothetical protein